MTTRQHTTEIILPASPEQVWRQLTEAGHVATWYAPEARIDLRVGGDYFVSWGPGMSATATIEIVEPNRHLRAVAQRGTPEAPVPMAVDFLLDEHTDGARLRVVQSGFLSTAEWDNEYNGTKQGWPIMLRILGYGLRNHPGMAGAQRWIYSMTTSSPADAWTRFASLFQNEVAEYSNEPSEFCAPWSEPGPGLVYAAFAERKGVTGVSLHVMLYGEAAGRIEAAAADWKARLDGLYGASAPENNPG